MRSKHPTIQKLMDEVESLDLKDSKLEEKLQLIAQKVAIEQKRIQAQARDMTYNEDDTALIDPSESFACEGCQ
jgi:hypothetical protein